MELSHWVYPKTKRGRTGSISSGKSKDWKSSQRGSHQAKIKTVNSMKMFNIDNLHDDSEEKPYE